MEVVFHLWEKFEIVLNSPTVAIQMLEKTNSAHFQLFRSSSMDHGGCLPGFKLFWPLQCGITNVSYKVLLDPTISVLGWRLLDSAEFKLTEPSLVTSIVFGGLLKYLFTRVSLKWYKEHKQINGVSVRFGDQMYKVSIGNM